MGHFVKMKTIKTYLFEIFLTLRNIDGKRESWHTIAVMQKDCTINRLQFRMMQGNIRVLEYDHSTL